MISPLLLDITSDMETDQVIVNYIDCCHCACARNRKCRTCFTTAAPVSNDLFITDIRMDARKRIQDACLAADLHEKDI